MRTRTIVMLVLLLIAGSFVAGSWYSRRELAVRGDRGARRILYYRDPMHPAYTSDRAGIAPDCGMQLEPVYADDVKPSGQHEETASSLPPGTVQITPQTQQLIGVGIGQVERTPGVHTLRLLGRVAADETKLYRLNAAVDGWIRNISTNTAGTLVKKDEALAFYYAPEFLSAEQAYLYALGALDRWEATGKETPEQIQVTKANIQQAEDSLSNLGMSQKQIEELKRTRKLTQNIEIIAPATGFVLARNVSSGQRFEKGTEWYRIADLSHVWVLADLFENEAEFFRPGTTARVVLPHQAKSFPALVSGALPQFDPAARTLKVRLEVDNADYALRPEMFVDVELPVKLPAALWIPAEAVLDTGMTKTVFVERGNGFFEPRAVETGWRLGNRVEIVKGLEAGERIVISGNFLLNSESRLQAIAAATETGSVKDPVCGMSVAAADARAAGRTIEHGGKILYFCSDHCKKQFEENPRRFLGDAVSK